jgi:hypothetical protein
MFWLAFPSVLQRSVQIPEWAGLRAQRYRRDQQQWNRSTCGFFK